MLKSFVSAILFWYCRFQIFVFATFRRIYLLLLAVYCVVSSYSFSGLF